MGKEVQEAIQAVINAKEEHIGFNFRRTDVCTVLICIILIAGFVVLKEPSPIPFNGYYNVAIIPFDFQEQDGTIIYDALSVDIAEHTTYDLNSHLNPKSTEPIMKPLFDVKFLNEEHRMRVSSSIQRLEKARTIMGERNIHILIYGYMSQNTSTTYFTLEIYTADTTLQDAEGTNLTTHMGSIPVVDNKLPRGKPRGIDRLTTAKAVHHTVACTHFFALVWPHSREFGLPFHAVRLWQYNSHRTKIRHPTVAS